MKTHILISSRVLLVAAMLLVAATAGGAPGAKMRVGKRPAAQPGTFSRSATYSGYVSGTIRIGDVEYRISPTASIYVVGEGAKEPGFAVTNASLYLAGRKGPGLTVTSVVVLPGGPPGSERRLEAGSVGTLSPGSPS